MLMYWVRLADCYRDADNMAAGFFHRLARKGTGTAARCGERRGAWRFLRDVRGGATSIFAVMVAVMTVAAAALIVDHNWLVDQRDTIKNATDAAAVAATIEMTRPGIQSKSDSDLRDHLEGVAETYATLNLSHLSGERLKRAKDSLDVEVTPKRASNSVEVSVSADLGGTLFSRHLPVVGNYAGPEKIGTVASVESTSNPVEVVLAVDVSYSMLKTLDGQYVNYNRSDHRMAIVKQAATSLVDILDPNAENRVAVGLVPWQAQVRLDKATRDDWSNEGWAEYPKSRRYGAIYACKPQGNCSSKVEDHDLPRKDQLNEAWLGCLDEHRVDKVDDQKFANLPPESALLDLPAGRPFAQGFFYSFYGLAYRCLSQLPINFDWQYCYGTSELWEVDDKIAPQRTCFVQMPTILPLTSDATQVRNSIANLVPVNGPTYSALGVLWGQRLLSHSWKSVWGDDVHPVDPASEDGAGARKVLVLLTDGEDNQCGESDPSCTTNSVGIAREKACEVAKAAGTEIFVIAAMHPDDVSGTLAASLRACSSQTDNPKGKYVFLNNSEPETLKDAFADIANQLKVFRRVY